MYLVFFFEMDKLIVSYLINFFDENGYFYSDLMDVVD